MRILLRSSGYLLSSSTESPKTWPGAEWLETAETSPNIWIYKTAMLLKMALFLLMKLLTGEFQAASLCKAVYLGRYLL